MATNCIPLNHGIKNGKALAMIQKNWVASSKLASESWKKTNCIPKLKDEKLGRSF